MKRVLKSPIRQCIKEARLLGDEEVALTFKAAEYYRELEELVHHHIQSQGLSSAETEFRIRVRRLIQLNGLDPYI